MINKRIDELREALEYSIDEMKLYIEGCFELSHLKEMDEHATSLFKEWMFFDVYKHHMKEFVIKNLTLEKYSKTIEKVKEFLWGQFELCKKIEGLENDRK